MGGWILLCWRASGPGAWPGWWEYCGGNRLHREDLLWKQLTPLREKEMRERA